jgi:hypothetical protein
MGAGGQRSFNALFYSMGYSPKSYTLATRSRTKQTTGFDLPSALIFRMLRYNAALQAFMPDLSSSGQRRRGLTVPGSERPI